MTVRVTKRRTASWPMPGAFHWDPDARTYGGPTYRKAVVPVRLSRAVGFVGRMGRTEGLQVVIRGWAAVGRRGSGDTWSVLRL